MSLELIELKNRINTLEILCSKYNHFGLEMNAMNVYIVKKLTEIENYEGTDRHIRDFLGEIKAEIITRLTRANNYLYIPERWQGPSAP